MEPVIKSMKTVAHRGESFAAPENTLESFTLAWVRGADSLMANRAKFIARLGEN